jgi:hypothetical protein
MATFNYSSKSSIKDNLTEILVGAGLIIVPVVYPFGIKVGTLRILGPLPTAIILALVNIKLYEPYYFPPSSPSATSLKQR